MPTLTAMHRLYYYRHGPGTGDAHFEKGWREGCAGRLAGMPAEQVGDLAVVWTNSHMAVGVITAAGLRCDWPSGWKYRNVAVKWVARAPMRDVPFGDRFDVWKRATMGEEGAPPIQAAARRVAAHVIGHAHAAPPPPQVTVAAHTIGHGQGAPPPPPARAPPQVTVAAHTIGHGQGVPTAHPPPLARAPPQIITVSVSIAGE